MWSAHSIISKDFPDLILFLNMILSKNNKMTVFGEILASMQLFNMIIEAYLEKFL